MTIVDSPAAERNKQPIASVLAHVLPRSGLVLEVAAGSGQHAEYFARMFPDLVWQPSELGDAQRAALAARVRTAGLDNLREPLAFDVHAARAPVDAADAVVCINMIHIAPWSATEALLRHAQHVLSSRAPLILYGPFKRDGEHTAPSNAAFDASLRRRNPAWGVRDFEAVDAVASQYGFELAECIPMPANNFTNVWRCAG